MDEQYIVILRSNLLETHFKNPLWVNPFSEHSHFVSLYFGSHFIFMVYTTFCSPILLFSFYPLKKKRKKETTGFNAV